MSSAPLKMDTCFRSFPMGLGKKENEIKLEWCKIKIPLHLRACSQGLSAAPSGNWTQVSHVTGGYTDHYTNRAMYSCHHLIWWSPCHSCDSDGLYPLYCFCLPGQASHTHDSDMTSCQQHICLMPKSSSRVAEVSVWAAKPQTALLLLYCSGRSRSRSSQTNRQTTCWVTVLTLFCQIKHWCWWAWCQCWLQEFLW